jgi:hypothetical protein
VVNDQAFSDRTQGSERRDASFDGRVAKAHEVVPRPTCLSTIILR